MRLLSYLFTLFFAFNALAAAPYGIKGQSQSGTLYSNVHQFPNQQVTNLGGINALVETGNKNILVNPSFEHSTFSTGWTNSAGTFTEETSLEIDGLKAAKLVLSSQTMSLTQSSTLYASQFADGVQGLAMVRVKSDVALKVCAIQAGVVSTSLCADVPAHNKWGLYKVPFILGATSNGISIASSGNVSGTVYVDDGFLGAVDLKADVPVAVSQSTRFTAGSTGAGVTLTGTPTTIGSGNYTVSSGVFTALKDLNVNFSCTTTNSAASHTGPTIYVNGASTGQNSNPPQISGFSANSSWSGIVLAGQNFYCVNAFNTASSGQVNVLATNTVNTSVYSSTNADTDWANFVPTGTWIANTTYSGKWRRVGDEMEIQYYLTLSGAPTAANLTVSMPNGYTIDTSKLLGFSAVAFDYQLNGNGTALDSGVQAYQAVPIYSTTSVIGVSRVSSSSGTNPVPVNVGNAVNATNPFTFASGDAVTLRVKVPVINWTKSNIIIGQFNGLESCTDTYQCTDTFSAEVSSAGVVSTENIDWINGNATVTDTSLYTFTWKTGIFTTNPNCVVNATNGSQNFKADKEAISTSTTGAFRTANSTTGAKAATGFTIICQKQGADYIGKTAKAVASDQNVRQPGIVDSKIRTANLNCDSSSSIMSQKGTWISTIGNIDANGNCTVTLVTNSFTAIPDCQMTRYATGGFSTGVIVGGGAQSSSVILLDAEDDAGVTATTYDVTLTCVGE